MVKSTIVRYTDARIKKRSEPLSKTADVRTLIIRMREAMETHNGIGIAAPQMSENVRVFLVAKDLFPDVILPSDVFINPKVRRKGFKREISEEGCLSVPNVFGQVSRKTTITVEAYDQQWKKFKLAARGLLARVLQHELDHLDGTLFIDKAEPGSLHEISYDKEGKAILRLWRRNNQ